MINKIKNSLTYIADLYRTAPLGETICFLNASQIPFDLDKPAIVGIALFGSFCGVALAIKQFKLRRRLEKDVLEKGYDDRIFEKTIPEWCDRQTARVAARTYGHLDDYVNLCKRNKDRMNFPDLFNL